jgi:hypothetical protein
VNACSKESFGEWPRLINPASFSFIREAQYLTANVTKLEGARHGNAQ